ncbi:protein phosphatase 2C domain-containing protein [Streptomyces zingiberis]|uniref:protein phosphatase 2C domain-containing protein n=1 Tax=Streptomyces zingiberis TaxID=2053010 RepID=UPI002892E88B|nr:protein phosphatase 2C domain-containing protein [Streptomyces zingiberis]
MAVNRGRRGLEALGYGRPVGGAAWGPDRPAGTGRPEHPGWPDTGRPAGPGAGTALVPAPAGDGPRARTAPGYVGERPPTYEGEPTALPQADPDRLDDLVPDTVLDGARYGTMTLRSASLRGDSARYRGEPRRDALLTVRFGRGDEALLLIATATGGRAAGDTHRAAADLCHWIATAVGRSHARLAEDIREGRRGALKSGLHRLTSRSYGRLRARAAGLGVEPSAYASGLRCLLLPVDPACRTRVFFGIGGGGLFRLRDGEWEDLEPRVPAPEGGPAGPVAAGAEPGQAGPVPREARELPPGVTADDRARNAPPLEPAARPAPGPGTEGRRFAVRLGTDGDGSTGVPGEPPHAPFRFRAAVARPGDTLLLCTAGLAEPLRGEPALAALLAERWAGSPPPGLAAYLSDVQTRVKGYADDRTAAAVWES